MGMGGSISLAAAVNLPRSVTARAGPGAGGRQGGMASSMASSTLNGTSVSSPPNAPPNWGCGYCGSAVRQQARRDDSLLAEVRLQPSQHVQVLTGPEQEERRTQGGCLAAGAGVPQVPQ